MHFHIVTLFPEAIEEFVKTSIVGRAIKDKKIFVHVYNPRDFTKDKWHRVDQRPYGGGPGMVLEAEPIVKAVKRAVGRNKNVPVLITSAQGKEFNELEASKISKSKHVVIIAGHYEGIDDRVRQILKAKEYSVGPYILTGGELPALVMMDAVSRFIPGVLGNIESLEGSRVASSKVYTRPEILSLGGKKYRVPKVLLTGHHAKIEEWRLKQSKKAPRPISSNKRTG